MTKRERDSEVCSGALEWTLRGAAQTSAAQLPSTARRRCMVPGLIVAQHAVKPRLAFGPGHWGGRRLMLLLGIGAVLKPLWPIHEVALYRLHRCLAVLELGGRRGPLQPVPQPTVLRLQLKAAGKCRGRRRIPAEGKEGRPKPMVSLGARAVRLALV